MKTKTTTREYDADGNMVKETVVEYEDAPVRFNTACTCAWGQYSSSSYCPVHGYRMTQPWTVTCGTSTTSPTYTINVAASNVPAVAGRSTA